MSQISFLALLALLLALLAVRPDTPAATTPGRVRADMYAAGWKRVVGQALLAFFGALALVMFAALRASVYGSALGVAAAACLLASLVAIDRRPVRLQRAEVRA